MKKFLIVALFILTGCANFTHAQVGPDRYAITSKNNEYTRLLEIAYNDCRNSGHKDYYIINTVAESRGMTLIVQCVDIPSQHSTREEKNAATSTASAEGKENHQSNDASLTIQKVYKDLKDSLGK